MEKKVSITECDRRRRKAQPRNFVLSPVHVRRTEPCRCAGNAESCTQTSKTIIELARLEADRISPDSLDPTPRIDEREYELHRSVPTLFPGRLGLRRDAVAGPILEDYDERVLEGCRYPLDGCREASDGCYGFVRREMMRDVAAGLEKCPVFDSRDRNPSECPEQDYKSDLDLQDGDHAYTPNETYAGDAYRRIDDLSTYRKNPEPSKLAAVIDAATKNPVEVFHARTCDSFPRSTKALPPPAPVVVNLVDKVDRIQRREGSLVDQFLTHKNRRGKLSAQSFKSRSYVEPSSPPPILGVVKGTRCRLEPGERKVGSFIGPKKEGLRHHADAVPRQRVDQAGHLQAGGEGMMDYVPRLARSEELTKTAECRPELNVNQSASTLFGSGVTDNGLFAILSHVRSPDWCVSLKGFTEIVEVARCSDPDILLPHMTVVNQKLIQHLRCSRSHVSRTACQMSACLFELLKDTRRPEFDDIVDVLLQRTADSNKFIRHDANLALDSMVTHVPTYHSIRAICSKGPVHRNPLVRCAAARLVICAVVLAGPDVVLNGAAQEHTRRRVLLNVVHMLEDRNLDTRKYGERLYRILTQVGDVQNHVKRYLDRTKYESFLRLLASIKWT